MTAPTSELMDRDRAVVNQALLFQLWFGLAGDADLVSRALDGAVSPAYVSALAHDFQWEAMAKGKARLGDPETDKLINRAFSYAQGKRLQRLAVKVLEGVESDPAKFKAFTEGVDGDGNKVYKTKPLLELAKAIETANNVCYRALGDKVIVEEQNADGTMNLTQLKELSLNVVNCVNRAAVSARDVASVVESIDADASS